MFSRRRLLRLGAAAVLAGCGARSSAGREPTAAPSSGGAVAAGGDAAGAASFAPFMHPNGQQIIFSSNLHDPTGRSFALYLVSLDGSDLERLTWAESFASFPMFSRDGRQLVFCSTRGAGSPREINVFVADWVGSR